MFLFKCCESCSLLYQLNLGPLHESEPRIVSKGGRVSLGRGSEALGCVSVHYGDRSWNWSRAGGTWRTRICKHISVQFRKWQESQSQIFPDVQISDDMWQSVTWASGATTRIRMVWRQLETTETPETGHNSWVATRLRNLVIIAGISDVIINQLDIIMDFLSFKFNRQTNKELLSIKIQN